MSTIGRTYVGPARDYATNCDVCGVKWHRSDLSRRGNLLLCPDDVEGRIGEELDRANAQGAAVANMGQRQAVRR